ncbi:Metallo-dependent phosphatase [Macrolepiota fuliginosa MF-IS2]|uniref:Metallo-dependent phosphatase n=1 Tax=Macrolepiota fuliginosa MF-IS2 TaxID=1400762 RepID=A0A9P5XAJ8_9AGAR|nr:Metallo-dependent phosphatase [Macrolepiota fuliginosa MF-IS2]
MPVGSAHCLAMHLSKLLLLIQICFVQPILSTGNPGVKVDRLISRCHELQGRDAGFVNGGNSYVNGHENDGRLKSPNNFEISFYHINDVHAHLDEFKPSGSVCADSAAGCVGGYPRVKTVIEQQRPGKKNSLFLNAGDEFQGTLFYTIYKGEKIAQTLNQLGFDAMTLGNHEFDDGDDLLSDFLANLTFPIISSNIHTQNPKLAKHLVPFKVFNKYNLALLAVTTETTASTSNPSNLTTFEDPATAAQRTINLIKRYHPSIERIVALTHIGYAEDIRLAQNTSGISLIIGGHSHTLLGNMTGAAGPYPTITKNLDGDEVFVVTAYKWGEYLGYIDVEYDRRGKIVSYEGAPIHLTNATAEEPGLKAQVTEWEKVFEVFARNIVGFTQTTLVQTTCQQGECTLGDVTADALEAYRPDSVAAIMNAGGIRIQIDAGNVTQQQVLDCFPFGNSFVQLDFTGAQLWDVFESTISRVSVNNGRVVTSSAQVSKNIRLTYNPSNPNGSKLITLAIAGQPVVLSQTYRIATVDFLAQGGDNLWPARSDFTILETVDQVWVRYIEEHTPLNYQLEGRISVTNETTPQKGNQ